MFSKNFINSPVCGCGLGIQNLSHILFFCPGSTSESPDMISLKVKAKNVFLKHGYSLTNMDCTDLLCAIQKDDLDFSLIDFLIGRIKICFSLLKSTIQLPGHYG